MERVVITTSGNRCRRSGAFAVHTARVGSISDHRHRASQFPGHQFSIARDLGPGPARPGRTGRSRDLATLAHLTVLESISLWADIRSDVPASPLGTRLDTQVKQLWDTAAVFEESVSANPPNAQTLPGILPGYRNLQAASREIESEAAGTGGLSLRVAGHLADISRLTAATDAMMRAIESEYLATVAVPAEQARTRIAWTSKCVCSPTGSLH